MEIQRIKETCLYVSDLDASRAFYEDRLGLDCFAFAEGRHAFFRAGSSVLLCFLPDVTRNETRFPAHYGAGKLHLAFEVAKVDYDKWTEKVTEQDIEITHEHDWGSGFLSFYFEDPDGHVLEIIQAGMWEK